FRERAAARQAGPVLQEVEAYYTALIAEREADVRRYGGDSLADAFRRDLKQLDAAYAELRTELATAPDKRPVRVAMTQNLRLRIDLLNEQLFILQNTEAKKRDDKYDL
ncbi:MAG: hypothetical protein WBA12_05175, partial [Catalinimonas sp.]